MRDGGSGWLATHLDRMMLMRRGQLHEPLDAKEQPVRSGEEVADELNGRMLLRYVLDDDVHEAGKGRWQSTFVTPTPYSVDDLPSYLALPIPDVPRRHVVFLDPGEIDQIIGPRRVVGGEGIEYLLPGGYRREAVLEPGWAVRVR